MRITIIAATIAVISSIGCVAQGQGFQYRSPELRSIEFNGTRLSAKGFAQLERIEAQYQAQLPNGRYWYDKKSGVVGKWGGPPVASLPAGLSLGGRLPAHASASRLRVFVNGRAIHQQEYVWFGQLFGKAPAPGYYWLDSQGNIGQVGVRGSINVVALARRRARTAQRGNARRGNTRRSSKNWNVYQRGIGGSHRSSIGLAGDGKTTCVNTASYTRCYTK